jgi:hypothetical protein
MNNRPLIIEIINEAGEPVPERVLGVLKKMRLKIDDQHPGRHFKFIVSKKNDQQWDVRIQFADPKTKK